MKIALITDDGQTISQHFGRAPYYLVVTIEEGRKYSARCATSSGHNHFVSQEQGEHKANERHGFDPGSQTAHQYGPGHRRL
jgi:predicted Fe-Mo cluster-binding NifX family protein